MCKGCHDFTFNLIYVVKDGTGPKYKKYIKKTSTYSILYSILLYYIHLKNKYYWRIFFYNLKLICNNDYFDILLCTSSLFIYSFIKSQNINVIFSRSYNEYPFFILCFIMWCLNIKPVFQCI